MPLPYAPVSAPKSSMPTTSNLPQPRDVAIPDFTSNTYVPFGVVLTGNINAGANYQTVWAPRETRFVLRGGYILVVCSTAAVSAAPGVLFFADEVYAPAAVLPITFYPVATPAGWVNDVTPWHFDLGKGYRSAVKNNRLRIGGSLPIGAGVFECYGLVWGIQE